MISDFLVAHSSFPFFSLNECEWNQAVRKYPSLLNRNGIDYVQRSYTASINPDHNNYFNNEIILQQFERLFQMLEFKKDYKLGDKRLDIEVMVDNARTHTALDININDFRYIFKQKMITYLH